MPKSIYNPPAAPVPTRSVSTSAIGAGANRSGSDRSASGTPQPGATAATAAPKPDKPVIQKTRKPTVAVAPALGVQARRAASATHKAKPLEKPSAASSSNNTGPGIPKPETAVVDRAAQAAAVLKARREAADKGREAVRMWAEQQKAKQAAAARGPAPTIATTSAEKPPAPSSGP